MSKNIFLYIFTSLLIFDGCLSSTRQLNYTDVNDWGKDHGAYIFLTDSTSFYGTHFFMTRDSASWEDPPTKRTINVPSHLISKIEFDKGWFTSPGQVIGSSIVGGTLALSAGARTKGWLAPVGFILGYYLSNTFFYKDNIFIFYPEPISSHP